MNLLKYLFYLLAKINDDAVIDSFDSVSSVSSTATPIPSPPLEAYNIRTITSEDEENVICFLRRFFFRDEPLNVNVKLLDNENSTCPELEEYSVKTIKDGLSVVALTRSGQIIGVSLNGVIRKKDCEKSQDECTNEKFNKITNFLKFVDRETDIFGKYPEFEKILCVKILSVDGSWRGRGIAKELMDVTRETAKGQDFGLMRGDCTSYYSAKALARLGFTCIYSLKYEDYLEDGQPVFDPGYPHLEFKVYAQKIA